MDLYTPGGDEPGWHAVDADWHRQNGYPQELAHFLHCIEPRQAPLVGVADGRAAVAIALAATESGRTHQPVELAPA